MQIVKHFGPLLARLTITESFHINLHDVMYQQFKSFNAFSNADFLQISLFLNTETGE